MSNNLSDEKIITEIYSDIIKAKDSNKKVSEYLAKGNADFADAINTIRVCAMVLCCVLGFLCASLALLTLGILSLPHIGSYTIILFSIVIFVLSLLLSWAAQIYRLAISPSKMKNRFVSIRALSILPIFGVLGNSEFNMASVIGLLLFATMLILPSVGITKMASYHEWFYNHKNNHK